MHAVIDDKSHVNIFKQAQTFENALSNQMCCIMVTTLSRFPPRVHHKTST